MQSSLYVALSGQVALQKRLDTIANNIANMNTGGYRAEEVSFATVLSKSGRSPTAFATAGDTYVSRRTGEMVSTATRSTSPCRETAGLRCARRMESLIRATVAFTWTRAARCSA